MKRAILAYVLLTLKNTSGQPLVTPFTNTLFGQPEMGDYRTPGSLSSVPIEGGPVTVLVTESALQPVLCGESVCWFTGPALDMRLRQLVPGGSPTTLATGLSQAHDVVFDGQYFFVTTGRGALERIPAAGGTPALSQAGGSGLALDDECLYWSDFPGIYAWALSAARK